MDIKKNGWEKDKTSRNIDMAGIKWGEKICNLEILRRIGEDRQKRMNKS